MFPDARSLIVGQTEGLRPASDARRARRRRSVTTSMAPAGHPRTAARGLPPAGSSSSDMTPAITAAACSPREWPITRSRVIPSQIESSERMQDHEMRRPAGGWCRARACSSSRAMRRTSSPSPAERREEQSFTAERRSSCRYGQRPRPPSTLAREKRTQPGAAHRPGRVPPTAPGCRHGNRVARRPSRRGWRRGEPRDDPNVAGAGSSPCGRGPARRPDRSTASR